ncbi:MAG: TspO/MBR family protein [Patescibacteria group bacterium]|jgi:tryptophan-rich sensory protein
MPKNEIGIRVFAAVVFVCAVSGLGSAFTMSGLAPWYQTLRLPSYAPAGNIIGLVWTLLFALLAASIIFSWNAAGKHFFKSVGPLYVTNGLLNVLWSFVFFSLHDLTAAAVTAGILGFSVLVLIFANLKVSKIAAGLLVPYFLWVSFATVLNVEIVLLNPAAPVANNGVSLPMPGDRVDEVSQPKSSTFTFATGVKKVIDSHLSLTLDRVNDSRCPADVQCIWQGELSPEFTAILDGVNSQVRLGTVTVKNADVGPYHLTLVDAGLESAKLIIRLP